MTTCPHCGRESSDRKVCGFCREVITTVIETSKTLNSEREALIFMMAYNLGAQSDSELSSARIDPEEPFTILLNMTEEEEEQYLDDENRKKLADYPSVVPGPEGQLPDVSKLTGKELLDIYLEGLDQAEPGKAGFGAIHESARRRLEAIEPVSTPVILVILNQGLVHDVVTQLPADYIVVDTDVEGSGEEDISLVPIALEKYTHEREMFKPRHRHPVSVDKEAVAHLLNVHKKVSQEP